MDNLCKHCEKTFIDKNTLLEHMMTHTGGKQCQCYICDKICSNKSSLKLHMMTHTGENSYKCCVCEIVFLHTSALKIHMKIQNISKFNKLFTFYRKGLQL